jgi:phage terminase large subunit GpA-like protein
MQNNKIVRSTRSEFSEKFLYLNGAPFSLEDYPHMYDVYNSTAKEIVMKTSRQVAKSTTMANIMVTDCATHPYFKAMYVSPTVKQTKIFSNDRVAPVIEGSPLIKDYYVNSSVVQNVFTKHFLNGSRLYLQYALLNADKLRGISTDKIFFDEVQDLKEDVIPVIQESTSRSLIKDFMYAGTPKRSKGTLAKY